MKKILITTILTFIILASFLSTNVFAVTVTEDSFNHVLNNTFNLQSKSVEMDTSNDIIKILATNTNVKYNFNGNPKFTIDLEYTNKMTDSERKNENMKLYGLITAFSIVANHFSVEVHDATRYFVANIVNEKMYSMIEDDPFEEYDNAVEFASNILGWKDTFEDELFTIKLNQILETTENYKVQMILDVDLSGDFSQINKSGTTFEEEMEKNDTILDAAQNAADKWQEATKNEESELTKYEASLNAKILVEDLKEKLDVYKDSVQIDNKLYLKYSADEVYDIYMNMTSNAVKIFEKNTNYFKKSGYYYYDTGRLRTLPLIDYTDTLHSFLEVTSASESEASFDVILKNIVTGDIDETYKDGLKIVKKDGEWLIDSLKFKSKVEEWDTYPEYPVIEEEKENTQNKQENNKTEENKKEENKKEETTKNEVNAVVNTNKIENVNTENNTSNISNQTTNVTTTESTDTYIIILKYALYVAIGLLAVGLIYFVYKIIKYRKDDDNKSV